MACHARVSGKAAVEAMRLERRRRYMVGCAKKRKPGARLREEMRMSRAQPARNVSDLEDVFQIVKKEVEGDTERKRVSQERDTNNYISEIRQQNDGKLREKL